MADGKTGHNVLYGRTATVPAPTIAHAQAIFAALTTGAAWTAFAGHLSTSTLLASVTIKSVHVQDQAMVQSTGSAVPGTHASVSTPNETALVVSLRTALSGKSNRGRMYIPGYSVGVVNAANQALATTVTDTTTWASGIIGIFAAQSYTLVIGQRARAAYIGSTGTAHPARVATSTTVTQLLVRNNSWDSQRRRGLK
jgi:hypothetical protein